MRKQSILVITALVGVVLSVAGAMQAQYVPHYVAVSVPFEFAVGEKVVPAGDYKLVCTPSGIEFRDPRGQVIASALHHAVRTADTAVSPKLVFVSEGGAHVLQQVWPGGTNYGYELAPINPALALAKRRSSTTVQAGGGGNK
jgi:hypothetical protein